MATQDWCAVRLGDWFKKNPTKGPGGCKEKLEGDYGIKLEYSKAWSGMKVALEKIHGNMRKVFNCYSIGMLILKKCLLVA
jgi:hypothetical protein